MRFPFYLSNEQLRTDDTALTRRDEVAHVRQLTRQLRRCFNDLIDFSCGFSNRQTIAVNGLVSSLEGVQFSHTVTGATKTDDIQAVRRCRIAVTDHKGRNVHEADTTAAHHGQFTDTAELVDSGLTAHDGAIAQDRMTGQCHIVGKDRIVAHSHELRERLP